MPAKHLIEYPAHEDGIQILGFPHHKIRLIFISILFVGKTSQHEISIREWPGSSDF